MLFWILWSINAVVTALFLYYFLVGLGDGSVDARNILLWVAILSVLATVLAAAYWLKQIGHTLWAHLLMMPGAVSGFLAGTYLGMFLIMLLTAGVRWN